MSLGIKNFQRLTIYLRDFDKLDAKAQAMGTSTGRLVSMILYAITKDDLIDGVLDGMDQNSFGLNRYPRRKSRFANPRVVSHTRGSPQGTPEGSPDVA